MVGAAPMNRSYVMKRNLALIVMTVATSLSAASAYAGCMNPRTSASAQIQIPMPSRTNGFAGNDENASKNIIGTWLVTYSAGGAAAGQAYIQWHADGTEWENINFPIEGGNICMGSWKTVDSKHVSRNHYGWLYTNGILSGYFNETETTEVGRNGTYTGVTDLKVYDVNGNLLTEFSGTSSAVLISP
jgi:hypothetical protein